MVSEVANHHDTSVIAASSCTKGLAVADTAVPMPPSSFPDRHSIQAFDPSNNASMVHQGQLLHQSIPQTVLRPASQHNSHPGPQPAPQPAVIRSWAEAQRAKLKLFKRGDTKYQLLVPDWPETDAEKQVLVARMVAAMKSTHKALDWQQEVQGGDGEKTLSQAMVSLNAQTDEEFWVLLGII